MYHGTVLHWLGQILNGLRGAYLCQSALLYRTDKTMKPWWGCMSASQHNALQISQGSQPTLDSRQVFHKCGITRCRQHVECLHIPQNNRQAHCCGPVCSFGGLEAVMLGSVNALAKAKLFPVRQQHKLACQACKCMPQHKSGALPVPYFARLSCLVVKLGGQACNACRSPAVQKAYSQHCQKPVGLASTCCKQCVFT